MWMIAEHLLHAHRVLLLWLAVGGAVTSAVFRYLPRGILELVVVLAKDNERRLAALEAIRLRRKDAATLPPYVLTKEPPKDDELGSDTPAKWWRLRRRAVRT
jgi:hypothetical protein